MKAKLSRVMAVAIGVLASKAAPAVATTVYSQDFVFSGTDPGGAGSGGTESLNTLFNTTQSNELTNGWAVFSTSYALDGSNNNITGEGCPLWHRATSASTRLRLLRFPSRPAFARLAWRRLDSRGGGVR